MSRGRYSESGAVRQLPDKTEEETAVRAVRAPTLRRGACEGWGGNGRMEAGFLFSSAERRRRDAAEKVTEPHVVSWQKSWELLHVSEQNEDQTVREAALSRMKAGLWTHLYVDGHWTHRRVMVRLRTCPVHVSADRNNIKPVLNECWTSESKRVWGLEKSSVKLQGLFTFTKVKLLGNVCLNVL